ncbi:hypothetical protein QQS21_004362 [Conoideocrella luteorostrata]|uniref:PAC domain-containing protein n=1 Tax=Conoideocrella luteorostrata TaxID=1105319 RepID=A0AAJ0CRJ7_9HYPO|nr:hypothetical protein QQS21_004362 [Conoideocrella luteorostrata]
MIHTSTTSPKQSVAPAPDVPRSPPASRQDNNHNRNSGSVFMNANSQSTREQSLNFDGFDNAMPGLVESSSRPSPVAPRSLRSRFSNASLCESAVESLETSATSLLPALQNKGALDDDNLQPLREDEFDPASFDIVAPSSHEHGVYSLAKRSELLFSEKHMGVILGDSRLLGQFTQFLAVVRPASVPLLTYYLNAEKAIRAIKYANSVASESLLKLDGHDFTTGAVDDTINAALEAKHEAAFKLLARDELPMYITHVWIRIVSLSIKRRIVGTMPMHLRDQSEGLAEVFCLTDPSRNDNPIILASDEFHRTTQYGHEDVIGRNCRFLQGPGTNPFSVKRIRDQLAAGREHFETFLNYRRDGSPFMNLLLCAPLIDSRGTVRYFLGAQVDVSGLAKDCTQLEGLKRIVKAEEVKSNGLETNNADGVNAKEEKRSATQSCRDLSEMFDRNEVETVRRYGGVMHKIRDHDELSQRKPNWNTPYLVIEEGTSPQPSPVPTNNVPDLPKSKMEGKEPSPSLSHSSNGRLTGVYEHYLLVRPAPSLQILFASPSLRLPGILQSPFLSRIGGSGRVRDQIAQALSDGRGVTAKVRWLSSTRRNVSSHADRGRPRWLHCTPLRGLNGIIGIWMIVVVNDDVSDVGGGATSDSAQQQTMHDKLLPRHGSQPKLAPPVASEIKGNPASFNGEDGPWPAW